MAVNYIFKDDQGDSELKCYINTHGRLFMEIYMPGEDIAYSGCLTLSIEDGKELIKYLIEEIGNYNQ